MELRDGWMRQRDDASGAGDLDAAERSPLDGGSDSGRKRVFANDSRGVACRLALAFRHRLRYRQYMARNV